jgi:nucleoside-diphosphate-sugar epimerase
MLILLLNHLLYHKLINLKSNSFLNKMKVTVLSHIYNEEYLLPTWLDYHKRIFDDGIIIDYNSTDRSLEIVKKICPHWKIIKSVNKDFEAVKVDQEVMEIENTIEGYKIALNTTEFLISTKRLDFILKENMYAIKPLSVARTDVKEITSTKDFINNMTQFNYNWRSGYRYIHNYPNGNYDIGRHGTFHAAIKTDEIYIAWVGFYPWNKYILNRKLQIQTQIPLSDKKQFRGKEHITDIDISNREASRIMENITHASTINPILLNYSLHLFEKILIIGGNGYIGSNLYDYLNSKKYHVDIMDIDWGENVKYIMDYKNITDEIIDKYDTVILLAGNSSIKSSSDMMSTFVNNVSNFCNLLSKIKKQKLIYASSASVYGHSDNFSDENTITGESHNHYDLSKKVIDMYANLSNKHVYGLRFGTVNGFSKKLRVDLVINSMVVSGITNNELYLYSKYRKRAILGINDLNKAIQRIIEYNDINKKGVYNLCSFNTDIESIAKTVSRILNVKIIEINEDTDKSTYSFELDNTKFKNKFDFTFNSNLQSIIEELLYHISNTDTEYCIRNIDKYKNYLWTCKQKNDCRVCFNKNILCVLDLGDQPLANNFHLNNKKLDKYPLKLMLCTECYHLQLSHIVNPNILFKNYIYVSGTSNTLIKYFKWFAEYTSIKRKIYNDTDLNIKVLEIACNDGSQLDQFNENVVTIGVDPAQNIYTTISSKKRHDIYCDYWNEITTKNIKTKYTNVDIIIAENVFGHTDDIHGFIENCREVMSNDSVLFIQTSQANMIRNNEYDTIYHEHLSFFSVKSMQTIVRMHGLYLNNVDKVDIHGTSFIFEISKTEKPQNITDVLKEEEEFGIHSQHFYKKYEENCIDKTEKLKNILHDYKKRNYKIVSYGGSAKGNTILNFIKNNYIDYIVDDNPLKWELYTPGTNIIVKDPMFLKEDKNKIAVLMLTWNFRDEIMKKINDLGLNVEYIEYQNI